LRAAFLQAGADIRFAAILVKSIRTYHPRAEIVQCSDEASPQVPGVDEVIRGGSARGRLMMFRTSLFARVAVTQPTLFLDTDMICIGTVELEAALGAHSVAVCTREFDRGGPFNINFRGMMMTEHAGKTLGEVYPYLGCATIVHNAPFWADCVAAYDVLPQKYREWYGDQEVIRDLVRAGRHTFAELPESVFACLPERANEKAKILHYKGEQRKGLMLKHANERGLI